jgi:tetraacyldisaccharide 4'-kinase
VYGSVTRLRNKAYDCGIFRARHSPLPVVSIGNLTVGGNGKTPLTIFLATELESRGWRPVVITRGYGGTVKGPRQVSGSDRPVDVGDEPCLMAHRFGLTVIVARDRHRGALFAAERQLGDIILLDDGFQHRRLSRDIDIVAINIGTPAARAAILEGALLPHGLFREDRDLALARADIIVCAERQPESGDPIPSEILSVLPSGTSLYRSFLVPGAVTSISDPTHKLSACSIVAFCGIANPDGFYATLESLGFTILKRYAFPDHHPFTDIAGLCDAHPGTPLVCTEKDALKLPPIPQVFSLTIQTKVYPADALLTEIERRLLGHPRFLGKA